MPQAYQLKGIPVVVRAGPTSPVATYIEVTVGEAARMVYPHRFESADNLKDGKNV